MDNITRVTDTANDIITPPKMSSELAEVEQNAIARTVEARAISEVQASVIMAKRYPRDEIRARDRILNACARPSLAERAVYLYSRGGSEISGASIRLAEESARQWGNIDYGWRTIEQGYDSSIIEAYAIDLESNVRRSVEFTVSHKRHTKTRDYLVTDPRDIYEMQANQAARRVRACILSLIPGDIIDDARDQCEQTLKTKIDLTPEKIKSLVTRFAELDVTVEQIEKRIQRKMDSIQPAQVLQLHKIYNSIKEGMSDAKSWFEPIEDKAVSAEVSKKPIGLDGLKNVIKDK